MPQWLVELLRCPSCGGELRPESAPAGPEGVQDARLRCGSGHSYPIRAGVPRFVDSDAYLSSFSFEWRIHRRTQFDSETGGASTRRFIDVTGLRPESLDGKTVLDAGVGTGRFADVVSRAGARLVGLDLSYAIDVARENLARQPNVGLVQGDIFSPPLKPQSFDFIYSIGVLHHTPDPERAVRSLVPLLKPGGMIAIYVYPRYGVSWRVSDFYRRLSVHLPHRLLYLLCHAAIPLHPLGQLPVVGPLLRVVLPISAQPSWRWRVLDTFDWYSPRYQSKHTYPEIHRWFRSCGLVDLELMDTAVCVRGRRPVQPESPE